MGGQQPIIIWLNAVLIVFTFTALCARVGRRVFVIGQFSWHDALITVAAVSAFVFSVCQIVGTSLGLGLHQKDVSSSDMPKLVKLIMASNVFYFLCNWAVKHALLLFYAEIVRSNKTYRASIYFMHFVAFGFGSSSILVNLFQCRPFRKAWDSAIPGYCVNLNIFFYFNAPIMLATDLVLYIMPVVFTRHLQLRRPQRIGLNCLFSLGGLVLAASSARVYSVHKFATQPDFPWWFANAMIWSVLENHLAIVVACAPSVKVIALLIFPRLTSSLRSLVSKVTPTNSRISRLSRSRSRVSGPFPSDDLESGTQKSGQSDKSGQLKPTPSSTPLPSPVLTVDSGASRASKNFARWFKSPTSPLSPTSPKSMKKWTWMKQDSVENHGLVYMEDSQTSKDVQLVSISKSEDADSVGRRAMSPSGDNDIRVEHTITVEDASARGSSDEEIDGLGRAV